MNTDDETIMKIIYQYGPASICIYSEDKDFMFLKGNGQWNQDCGKNEHPTHAIVVVGWTKTHWIVRNSWGKNWGKRGYLFLKKDGTNECKFHMAVGVPYMEKKE